MAKVTSKLQVTIPRALAREMGIRPGAEFEWERADEVLRIRPAGHSVPEPTREERLRIFDDQTARQRAREAAATPAASNGDRGWSREDLYDRGPAR